MISAIAAAHVSSGAALVLALNRPNWDGVGALGWKPADVVQHLITSADTIDGLKLACINGKRLNLSRAVYGPLRITAPVQGDELTVNVPTNITWTTAYNNPKFTHVHIDFVTTTPGVQYRLGMSPIAAGSLSWTPLAAQATTGSIRITPTTGNFPVSSGLILVKT